MFTDHALPARKPAASGRRKRQESGACVGPTSGEDDEEPRHERGEDNSLVASETQLVQKCLSGQVPVSEKCFWIYWPLFVGELKRPNGVILVSLWSQFFARLADSPRVKYMMPEFTMVLSSERALVGTETPLTRHAAIVLLNLILCV